MTHFSYPFLRSKIYYLFNVQEDTGVLFHRNFNFILRMNHERRAYERRAYESVDETQAAWLYWDNFGRRLKGWDLGIQCASRNWDEMLCQWDKRAP